MLSCESASGAADATSLLRQPAHDPDEVLHLDVQLAGADADAGGACGVDDLLGVPRGQTGRLQHPVEVVDVVVRTGEAVRRVAAQVGDALVELGLADPGHEVRGCRRAVVGRDLGVGRGAGGRRAGLVRGVRDAEAEPDAGELTRCLDRGLDRVARLVDLDVDVDVAVDRGGVGLAEVGGQHEDVLDGLLGAEAPCGGRVADDDRQHVAEAGQVTEGRRAEQVGQRRLTTEQRGCVGGLIEEAVIAENVGKGTR